MSKVRERQDSRRKAVMDAAAKLYSEKGYGATSMNDLAAEVGLSKPALYHYVRSKEDVLVQLYEGVMQESTDAIAEIEALDLPAIDALRAVIVQRVAYTCENQALLRVCFHEEAGLPREQLATVLQARRDYEDAVMAIAEQAVKDGKLVMPVSPRIYTNTILGAANWVYKWFDPKGPLGPRELGEQVAAAFLGPSS